MSKCGRRLIFQILSCRLEVSYCKCDKFHLKAMLIDVAMLSFLKTTDKSEVA